MTQPASDITVTTKPTVKDINVPSKPTLPPKIEKAFNEEFVKDNGGDVEPSFSDPNGQVGPIKQWFAQTLSTEIAKAVVGEKERINKELINTPFIIDSLSVEQQYEVSKYFGEVVESVL